MRIAPRTYSWLVLPFAAIASTAALAAGSPLDTALRLLQAQKDFDVPALERVLAPDYLEVSPVGDVDDRAKVISFYGPAGKAAFAAAGNKVGAVRYDEQLSRVDGDHAMVMFKASSAVEIQGKQRTAVWRVQMHLRRQGGDWVVESAQYTPFHPGMGKPAA